MVDRQPDGAGKDDEVRGQVMVGQALLVVLLAYHDDGAPELIARGRTGSFGIGPVAHDGQRRIRQTFAELEEHPEQPRKVLILGDPPDGQ